MKTLYCLLTASLCLLFACASDKQDKDAQREADLEKAQSRIEAYFEEKENRQFESAFPILVEGQDCCQIIVKGILHTGETYAIDTFAVNPQNDNVYFLDGQTGLFKPYFTAPAFACQTSPDGTKRIESAGMYEDGPSGLHALQEMRIIDMNTGALLWSRNSNLSNVFLWSEDSRYAAIQYAGRQWIQTDIGDTRDFGVIQTPYIDAILTQAPLVGKADPSDPMPLFTVESWPSASTLRVHFLWSTQEGTRVEGSYDYDVARNEMTLVGIAEKPAG